MIDLERMHRIQDALNDEEVIFCYAGYITEDVLLSVGTTIKQKLEVVRADRLMHGKTSPILHTGKGVFAGLPSPFEATRYHSLIVKRDTLPDVLEITAETAEGEIMGLQHKTLPVHGVQFHPESILTTEGKRLLRNFLEL